MALGSTQPLTEMNICDISGGGGGRQSGLRAGNLATFMCRLCRNPGSLNLVEPSGSVEASAGIALPLKQYTKIADYWLSYTRIGFNGRFLWTR